MRRKSQYTPKMKRWHYRRYQDRMRRGLCPICGKERTGEWLTCEACREKHRAYMKAHPLDPSANRRSVNAFRERCRQEGICYGCSRYIGLGGPKRCPACQKKDRDYKRGRYAQGLW